MTCFVSKPSRNTLVELSYHLTRIRSIWSIISVWSVWSIWSIWSIWSVWSIWSIWSRSWSIWSDISDLDNDISDISDLCETVPYISVQSGVKTRLLYHIIRTAYVTARLRTTPECYVCDGVYYTPLDRVSKLDCFWQRRGPVPIPNDTSSESSRRDGSNADFWAPTLLILLILCHLSRHRPVIHTVVYGVVHVLIHTPSSTGVILLSDCVRPIRVFILHEANYHPCDSLHEANYHPCGSTRDRSITQLAKTSFH